MKRQIAILTAGAIAASLGTPPVYAGILGSGLGGALSGAMVGRMIGGRSSARTGAIIGGVIGMTEAAGARQRQLEQQAEMARRQSEWASLQQAEQERVRRQQAAAAPVQATDQTLVVETQKSLIRLGYDPGAIGRPGPELTQAVLQYQKSKGLLETGELSQALLSHMLRNGG